MISLLPTTWTSWSTARYICEVAKDEETFIDWLMKQELIPKQQFCDEGHEMKKTTKKQNENEHTLGCFRCRLKHKDGKGRYISFTKGSCFENLRISPKQLVMIFLLFANDLPPNIAFKELTFFGRISLRCIFEWYSYCQEIIAEFLINNHVNNDLLGGRNTVVEVDILRFGKRIKFSQSIEHGMYVLGFIQHKSQNFHLELCTDDNYTAKKLLPLIKKHVRPGTTIMCESWHEFNNYGGYEHFQFRKVNYEGCAIKEGERKRRGEPAWRNLKRRLIASGTQECEMGDHFMKFLFHRKVTIDKTEPFEKFLNVIRLSYPISSKMVNVDVLSNNSLESSTSDTVS